MLAKTHGLDGKALHLLRQQGEPWRDMRPVVERGLKRRRDADRRSRRG